MDQSSSDSESGAPTMAGMGSVGSITVPTRRTSARTRTRMQQTSTRAGVDADPTCRRPALHALLCKWLRGLLPPCVPPAHAALAQPGGGGGVFGRTHVCACTPGCSWRRWRRRTVGGCCNGRGTARRAQRGGRQARPRQRTMPCSYITRPAALLAPSNGAHPPTHQIHLSAFASYA